MSHFKSTSVSQHVLSCVIFLLFYELLECNTESNKSWIEAGLPNVVDNPIEVSYKKEVFDDEPIILHLNDSKLSKSISGSESGSGESGISSESFVELSDQFTTELELLLNTSLSSNTKEDSSSRIEVTLENNFTVIPDNLNRNEQPRHLNMPNSDEKSSVLHNSESTHFDNKHDSLESDMLPSSSPTYNDIEVQNENPLNPLTSPLDATVSSSDANVEDHLKDIEEPLEVLYGVTEKSVDEITSEKEAQEEAHVFHDVSEQPNDYRVTTMYHEALDEPFNDTSFNDTYFEIWPLTESSVKNSSLSVTENTSSHSESPLVLKSNYSVPPVHIVEDNANRSKVLFGNLQSSNLNVEETSSIKNLDGLWTTNNTFLTIPSFATKSSTLTSVPSMATSDWNDFTSTTPIHTSKLTSETTDLLLSLDMISSFPSLDFVSTEDSFVNLDTYVTVSHLDLQLSSKLMLNTRVVASTPSIFLESVSSSLDIFHNLNNSRYYLEEENDESTKSPDTKQAHLEIVMLSSKDKNIAAKNAENGKSENPVSKEEDSNRYLIVENITRTFTSEPYNATTEESDLGTRETKTWPANAKSTVLIESSKYLMKEAVSPSFNPIISSPANDIISPSIYWYNKTVSELVTTPTVPGQFRNHSKSYSPIRPTKVAIVPDRRTKYNRLPADHNPDDKTDQETDSNWKQDHVLPTLKVPVAYLTVTMKCSWSYFCKQKLKLHKGFAEELMNVVKNKVEEEQVVFFNYHTCRQVTFGGSNESQVVDKKKSAIVVPLYVSDEWGVYSKSLTELLGVLIERNMENVTVPCVILDVHLHRREGNVILQEKPSEIDGNVGIIATITICCIAGICLLLIGILLFVLKRRHGLNERTGRCRPATDAYSLESVSSVRSSFCRRKTSRSSKRSHLNLAFDDPYAPSNKLNFTGLASACIDEEALAKEFKEIPMHMAKYDELPAGAEVKNRYANIIPFPETRVILSSKGNGKSDSDYINANYVRGYRGEPRHYIACQAPLEDTVTEFWHMVWDNQTKVIIMLTAIEEDGVNKCALYFSESDTIDCHRLYGDYQVTTKKKDVRESYTVSTLQVKNLEKNLMRDVVHFWYTTWPTHHVPSDHNSITELLVEIRRYTKSNTGPIVVHCSPGTGRTGCVLAIDICMHEFEINRMVDIPQCVNMLRQDRGGCVQTAEQYCFIYEVLGEYASRLINHSGKSSVRSVK